MLNLNTIAQDGRWGLEHSDQLYSLIEIDAYRPPYIPPHLTTLEFFQLCRDHLTDDGVIAMNVGRTPEDRSLVDALATTLAQVFPSVHIMDVPNSFNSIIYATVQLTSFETLQSNYELLSARSNVHPLLLASIERTLANQRETPTEGILLTDERAPVEWIVNKMVLNFFGSGGVEDLQ
jgi:spermidine synthase